MAKRTSDPSSTDIDMTPIAKPVDGPVEKPITLQLTREGSVIYAGELIGMRDVGGYLEREKTLILDAGKQPNAATVIVRADGDAKAGEVQEIVKICQEKGFEKFALRAKYDEGR
jgi:biopolymer transport protein ExbD